MTKRMMLAAGAGLFCLATPAMAQSSQQVDTRTSAPVGGVLTVFGNDPCPEDAICVRAPESDRFRIPSELRNQEVIAPTRESWAVRAEGALQAGQTGIGSCSEVGPGGSTGCFGRQAEQSRRENRQRRREEVNLPLP